MALQFHELTVAATIDETADSRSFVFAVPPELRERFAYRAGQFLTFEIPWTDFVIRRCYSLSSAPELDAAPRITVKRVAGGRMSNWLLDEVHVGDVLRVAPPDGRFVLDAEAGARPLTLYGGGSGITPLLSIAKTVLAAGQRDVTLIYANRDQQSIILKAELDRLLERHAGRFTLHYHCDCDGGFLTHQTLAPLLAGRHDGDHYVCGPAPFMDLVSRTLETSGVASERTRFERFISALDPDRRAAMVRAQAERAKAAAEAKAAAAAATNAGGAAPGANAGGTAPGASAAAATPSATAPAANAPAAANANDSAASAEPSESAPAPATFTLRLGSATHTVPYAPGLTLLAAAQRAGVGAPSSCEDGYCGTCAARLVHGKVTMRSTQALTPAELAAGAILLCQSLPAAAEPLEVTCAAPSAAAQPALPERPPQPLLPRVLASLFVLFVFALFFLFRSRP